MRKLLIIILMLPQMLILEKTQAQWIVEKSPTRNNLNSISFSENGFGCIVGEKGTILHRVNGNWVLQNSPSEADLFSVYVVDRNDAWAVGAKGTILHFTGTFWEKTESPTIHDLFSVSFRDKNNGVAAGSNGVLLFYNNGIWKTAGIPIRADLFTTTYLYDDVIAGGGREFLNVPVIKIRNNDPGTAEDIFNSNIVVTGITFSSPEDGWITGSPTTLLHYNGHNWEKPEFEESFPTLKTIYAADEKRAITAGYYGFVMTLTDKGWEKENSSTTENLNSAVITGDQYFVAGNKGTILTRSDERNVRTLKALSEYSPEISIYPNPCKDSFYLTIKNPGDNLPVTVSITDLDGRVVVQKKIYPSAAEFRSFFEIPGFNPGIYSVKASMGEINLHTKLIVN